MPLPSRPPPRSLRVLPSHSGRECGSCTACCTGAQVPDMEPAKPPGVTCGYLRTGLDKSGCGNYDGRPPSCASFKCLWLEGVGPAKHRPDRVGVFLAVYERPTLPETVIGVPGVIGQHLNGHKRVIAAVETWKDAAKTTANAMIRDMKRVAPVIVIQLPPPPEGAAAVEAARVVAPKLTPLPPELPEPPPGPTT